MYFYFTLDFLICWDPFSVFVGIKTCPCWICYECVPFQIEIRKISRCSSRSPNNAEFSHFTLLFSRGRQRMYQELYRTCTAIVLLIKPFFWWRSRCRCRCRCVLGKVPKRSLSKPRRRRQGEGHQTKCLVSITLAVHVRYESLCVSLPTSAKQQREMTMFCVLYGMWTNFWYFYLELNAVVAYLASVRFESHWRTART